MTSLHAACILVAVTALAACGSDDDKKKKEEPPPTQVIAAVAAAADVNPNVTGTPSPIFVRLYELQATAPFATTSFFALWDDEGKALGKSLDARHELVLSPGQSAKVEREIQKTSRFLGVAAAYQDIANATWRALTEIPANKTTTVQIDVGRLGVTTAVQNDTEKPAPSKPPSKEGK